MSTWVLYLTDARWTQTVTPTGVRTYLKGQIYQDDRPIAGDKLAPNLNAANSPQELCAKLKHLNGFYAWVSNSDRELRAGVDHIRSRPLFYGQTNKTLYLSDDAEWVRKMVGDQDMNPIAREEFQLAGYVTGQDTLFANVKQLQAGECLIATRMDQGLRVQTHRYYRFLHAEPKTYNETKLRQALDQAAIRSIRSLIAYAEGRQIVVPLSGGYDSRLIVTLLKRLGYENILTFTYGVSGNRESKYSKQVADALGLRWHFVQYDEALWRKVWKSSERWEYQKWASGWTSIPHVQDWLAVKTLKSQGVLASECVFAPGHSGDFVAGSHIPIQAFEQSHFDIDNVTESLFTNHYALAPIRNSERQKDFWEEHIRTLLPEYGRAEPCHYADAYETWDWQERQAKFIANSVRVYEFFGYEWWMPLWDREFVQFWQTVPLTLRKGRVWYVTYVNSVYSKLSATNRARALPNASETFLRTSLGKLPRLSVAIIRKVARRFTKMKSLFALEGRIDRAESSRLTKLGYSFNGVFAKEFLDRVGL